MSKFIETHLLEPGKKYLAKPAYKTGAKKVIIEILSIDGEWITYRIDTKKALMNTNMVTWVFDAVWSVYEEIEENKC